jgi:hypothetical protein
MKNIFIGNRVGVMNRLKAVYRSWKTSTQKN